MLAALTFVLSRLIQVGLDKDVYPLSPPQSSPVVSVDLGDATDLSGWADKAKLVATSWYPEICRLLATKDFKSPNSIRFVFRHNQEAPAQTGGGEVSFSIEYVRGHPHDLGMVVHELTHVVQGYPRNSHGTGWLVEGIADYVRWWRYEPEAPRTPIDFSKATYHDAYRTTAYFLAWSSFHHDQRLVPALDSVLRQGGDPMPVFQSLTGKTADELWEEFKADPMVFHRKGS